MKKTPLTRKTELKRTGFKPKTERVPKGESNPRRKKGKFLADGTRVPSDATLDTKMSLWVRRFGKCELAGHVVACGGTLEHHHVVPRGKKKALRWHPLNGLCICQMHHQWFHANPVMGGRLLDEVFGRERWDEVERIRLDDEGDGRVPTRQDKIEINRWLTEELKKWNSGDLDCI